MINGYAIQNMIKTIRRMQWISLEAMWAGAEKSSEAAIVIASAISGMRPDHSPAKEFGLDDLAILIEPLLREGLILFNATKVLEYGGTDAQGSSSNLRSGDSMPV
jgi:hypothetical protein